MNQIERVGAVGRANNLADMIGHWVEDLRDGKVEEEKAYGAIKYLANRIKETLEGVDE